MTGIFDSLFASNGMLTEQIAREVFSIVTDRGLFLVIADNDYNYWCNDEDQFRHFFADGGQIQRLCEPVNDVCGPVISQVCDHGMVVTQLTAGKKNCGYLIAVLTDCTPESTLAIIDIVEMVLNLVNLIANLIDKNNQLHHLQLKQLSSPDDILTDGAEDRLGQL